MKAWFCASILGLVGCLLATAASATDNTSIAFKIEVTDGPLKGYAFTGRCLYDSSGDRLRQSARCSVLARGPNGENFNIADSDARLAVVGNGHLLQIILGLNSGSGAPLARKAVPAFTLNAYSDRLGTLFPPLAPVRELWFSALGVAVFQECLIYEILGTQVHHSP